MAKPNVHIQDEAALLHREAIGFLQAGKFNEGIARLKKALKARPDSANILKDLGTASWQAGHAAEADKYYREALKHGAQNAGVLGAAGAFFHGQGGSAEAEKLLLEAVKIQPDNPEILNNLGLVFFDTKQTDKAEKCFDRALRFNPLWPQALYNKGRVLVARKKYMEAEAALRRTLQAAPGHAPAMTALGQVLSQADRPHEALPLLQKAVELYPAGADGWFALIGHLDLLARLEEAQAVIAQARKHLPETPELIFLEAKIARRQGGAEKAVAVMEKYRPMMKHTPPNAPFYYELGSLYDKLKRPDDAFESCALANRLWSKGDEAQKFDLASLPAIMGHFKKTFTPAWVGGWNAPIPYTDTPEPVFLVGFPRSGTTLLGQILSSHARIDVADEAPALETAIRMICDDVSGDYTAKIPTLSPDITESMRRTFFSILRAQGRDSSRPLIVDKMPLNMVDAGIIHRLFPNAKIILALRHPCDSVLSCFMQAFGANAAMVQFTDIENSARFYDQVFGLWEHYRAVLPLNVHAVKYEDIVGNFRPTVEPLLNFLGVEWSDSVLEHDKNARERVQTKTPSYSQVTEKIYTTSRGRWHGYRKHLEPALPILAPWAEKYGYDIG